MHLLIVDELPVPASAPAEGSAAADGRAGKHAGLQFVLRYSLPVFLLPATPRAPGAVGPAETALQPDLQIRLVRTGEQTQLEVANDGPAHAQIEDLGGWRAESLYFIGGFATGFASTSGRLGSTLGQRGVD